MHITVPSLKISFFFHTFISQQHWYNRKSEGSHPKGTPDTIKKIRKPQFQFNEKISKCSTKMKTSWKEPLCSDINARVKRRTIASLSQLVSLHHCAADGTVVPQHANVVEVETVLQEKLSGNLRKRAMTPKVNVWQAFENGGKETIGLVHMRIVIGFPFGKKQARNDLTHENMSHAGNARYAKSKINDGRHGGFGCRPTVTEIIGPDIEHHSVWRKLPN